MSSRPGAGDESAWTQPSTVAGFASGSPNTNLIHYARGRMPRAGARRAVDIGCGAGRNAIPLAAIGWDVLGLDLSMPMLRAAIERKTRDAPAARVQFALAAMDYLPLPDRSSDLIVAHGIWNLARSDAEFRNAVHEAGRVATPGASLFVFTFSRNTIADAATPVAGQSFVFTEFRGEPQCFLTAPQLEQELAAAGFVPDPAVPLAELNPRAPGMLVAVGAPVIWQGGFRFDAG